MLPLPQLRPPSADLVKTTGLKQRPRSTTEVALWPSTVQRFRLPPTSTQRPCRAWQSSSKELLACISEQVGSSSSKELVASHSEQVGSSSMELIAAPSEHLCSSSAVLSEQRGPCSLLSEPECAIENLRGGRSLPVSNKSRGALIRCGSELLLVIRTPALKLFGLVVPLVAAARLSDRKSVV